jgi:carboxyl-terminal processing protease
LIRRRVVLAALFAVPFVVGWWAGRGGAAGGLYGRLDPFIEILHRIEQNYVDPVEPDKLVAGAMRGMLRDLDPYSQYLDRTAYGNLQSVTHGRFGGIGVVVGIRGGYPTVISPIEGTPAWEAGMRSGDVIVRIEGRSTAGLAVEEVAERLRGPEGTPVGLAVAREGDADEHELTLTRRIIVTKSVPYAFVHEPGTGYVRLANFSETSGEELRAALAGLRRQGARAFVLDLRMNPGGLLEQAVDVAEQFLPRGALVVYTEGRARDADRRYTAADPSPDLASPLVVLVDGGSASASEIVAGALQDLDRALVLGRTTFGKGSVQSVFPLPNRTDAVKLTTSLYHTPSGRSIHRLQRAAQAAADAGEEDAEDAAGESDPHAAPADTAAAPRPRFRTQAGRTVYGGGGIAPDVEVRPDSLLPVVAEVERRTLAFRFATRWANAHPGPLSGDTLADEARRAYAAFLRDEKAVPDDAAWEAHRVPLERALRRELARRLAGDAGAARVALEGDAAARRAFEVLRRARRARDVFAGLPEAAGPLLAGAPAAAPGAGR